ncbi:MAG: hypothetical protein WAP36_04990 [Halanaerobiales bacterium]
MEEMIDISETGSAAETILGMNKKEINIIAVADNDRKKWVVIGLV